MKVTFISSDKSDILFKIKNSNFKCFYVSPILGQILLLNYISCKNLVLTMPDLNNFHIKKSFELFKLYLSFSFSSKYKYDLQKIKLFSYDKIFCLGQHHYNELSE